MGILEILEILRVFCSGFSGCDCLVLGVGGVIKVGVEFLGGGILRRFGLGWIKNLNMCRLFEDV